MTVPNWRELPPAGDWVAHAACKGMVDLFYPEPINSRPRRGPITDPKVIAAYDKAATICAGCPVFDECRSYAMTLPRAHMQGLIAGLRPRQLEELRFPRRNRRRSAA